MRSTRQIAMRTALVIAGMLVVTLPGFAQQNDVQQRLTTVAIPILVETAGKSIYVVGEARIDQNMQLVEVTSAEIAERMEPILRSDLVEPFENATADGWLSRSEADVLGIELVFDASNLAAQVVLPLEQTAERNVSVYSPRRIPKFPQAPNAAFRAVLPLEFDIAGSGEADSDLLMNYRGIVAPWVGYGSFVLENRTWIENRNGETNIETEDNRLVWDLPRLGSRLAAGQVGYRSRVFQTAVPLVGVSFYRVGTSVSQTAAISDYEQTITVESSATANVYMNDKLIRSYPLQPGRYRISDFPLAPGLNTISIEVVDEFGDVQAFGADLPFAGGLLETGYFDFGIAGGIRDWETDYPFLSGVGRYGMSRTVTAGGAVQLALDGQTMGIDALTATPYGSFGIDLVGSLNDRQDSGLAVQGNYQYIRNGAEWFPAIGVVSEYRTRQFVQAGISSAEPATAWIGRINVAQQLPVEVAAALSFEYRHRYDDENDQARVLLALTREFSDRVDARVNASVDVLNTADWSVFVGVNVVGKRGTFSSTNSVEAPALLMDSSVSGMAEGRTRTVSGSLGVDNIDLATSGVGSIGAGVRLSDQHYTASTRGNVSFAGTDPFWEQSVGSYGFGLRTGSAIYYADRTVGVGRPENGGFVLVDYADDVPANELVVNPHGNRVEGATGFLGPATLPGIRSGTPVIVETELPGLPADYALDPTRYVVNPTYRSGTVIRIGGTRRVYAKGQLVDGENQPIELVAIEVMALQESAVVVDSGEPIGGLSFTDESGTFEIYGLIPGEYRVTVLGRPGFHGTLVIEPGEERMVNVGAVEIGSREEEVKDDETTDTDVP